MKKIPRDATSYRLDVGLFLKHKRETAKLTQHEVAESLGYSTPQFVSNWERGISLPPRDKLPDISKLLAVPVKEMVFIFQRYQEEVCEAEKKEIAQVFRRAR